MAFIVSYINVMNIVLSIFFTSGKIYYTSAKVINTQFATQTFDLEIEYILKSTQFWLENYGKEALV